MKNKMKIEFDAISENEGFARVAVASFLTGCDPTLEEIADVKTAVSEAVTNAILHGYSKDLYGGENPKVRISCWIVEREFGICVQDDGV